MDRLSRERNWPGRHVNPRMEQLAEEEDSSEDVGCSFAGRRTEDDCAAIERCAGNPTWGRGSGRLHHDRGFGCGASRRETALRNHDASWVPARLAEAENITQGVMESTGSYWKPVFTCWREA